MIHYIVVAYIDPATGAIVLQALVALVLALSLGFRNLIRAPFRFLRRLCDGNRSLSQPADRQQ